MHFSGQGRSGFSLYKSDKMARVNVIVTTMRFGEERIHCRNPGQRGLISYFRSSERARHPGDQDPVRPGESGKAWRKPVPLLPRRTDTTAGGGPGEAGDGPGRGGICDAQNLRWATPTSTRGHRDRGVSRAVWRSAGGNGAHGE